MTNKNKTFELYDLKIEFHKQELKEMVCNHIEGSYFILSGENIIFPEGVTFPIYSFASLLPVLPTKQRETDPNDWMSIDHFVACPDPNCGGYLRLYVYQQKEYFILMK